MWSSLLTIILYTNGSQLYGKQHKFLQGIATATIEKLYPLLYVDPTFQWVKTLFSLPLFPRLRNNSYRRGGQSMVIFSSSATSSLCSIASSSTALVMAMEAPLPSRTESEAKVGTCGPAWRSGGARRGSFLHQAQWVVSHDLPVAHLGQEGVLFVWGIGLRGEYRRMIKGIWVEDVFYFSPLYDRF